MINKLLVALLGASVSLSAQLNNAGTGFTLDYEDANSTCYLNSAPNNGGVRITGNSIDVTDYLPANGPLTLVSAGSTSPSSTVTWFTYPVVSGANCTSLPSSGGSIDMTNDSKVTITAEASSAGAVLEFYLGGAGEWWPSSSTYNLGGNVSIIASHTFSGTTSETFTFDYATLDATNWSAWTGRNTIQTYGWRSQSNGVTFKINKIEFGSDASGTNSGGGGGGETCSDGIQNQDETGIDCGGATCSPCGGGGGGGGGNGQSCIVTTDDGLAQATFYTLLETGASTIVTCSFDAVADIKGTFYGALETATLHGPGGSTPATYCGMCVEMAGPLSTEIVQITDECPDCWEHNSGDTDIDLSTPAFAAIVGSQSIGRSDITWSEVSCPWVDNVHLIIQGSHDWYAKVIVGNHVNRIASVEISNDGESTWTAMTRGTDNGWVKGSFGGDLKSYKITDIYGSEIIFSDVDMTALVSGAAKIAGTENFPACGLTTSTNRVNTLDYVAVYPNPANNEVTFAGIGEAQTIEIVNISGQVVASQFLGGNIESASLDISKLAKGIYVAKLTGYNNTGVVSFVKK